LIPATGPLAITLRTALALPLLAASIVAAAHWPIAPALALAVVAAWTALSLWHPRAALAATLALFPVLGLAPWTGRLAIEEIDLLLAALATGALLRGCLPARPGAAAGPDASDAPAIIALALYAASCAVSATTGWIAAGDAPLHLTQGYLEPLNAVRLAKPCAWALLLMPALMAEQRADPDGLTRAIGDGMLGGLILCGIAAVWERVAFPGLTDFSSDYRTTALFWEMHVGGAALDAYLAMALPFAVLAALRATTPLRLTFAGSAVLLGAYASLTTFSRGVYLAVPIALAVALPLARAAAQRAAGSAPVAAGSPLRVFGALGGSALLAWMVFDQGGYRATGAALGALFAVVCAAPAIHRLGPARAAAVLAAGALAGAGLGLAASLVPKGPYLLHALICTGATATAWATRASGTSRARPWGTATLAGATLGTTVAVAVHWGGPAALPGAAGAMAILGLVALADTARPRGLWPREPARAATAIGAMAIAAGCVAVFSGGSYMGERFADSGRDLDGRLQHWRDGSAMIETPREWLFGNGLGRWPAGWLAGRLPTERPGGHGWSPEGNGHLVLAAAGHPVGWGEMHRVGQRVPALRGRWLLRMDVRGEAPVRLHLEICEKHLLYSGACATRAIRVSPQAGQWRTLGVELDGDALGAGPRLAPRLAMFALALTDSGTRLEIDNVMLLDPAGRQRTLNAGFDQALTHWFFTSDRVHLPWHAKNLTLHLLVEQGLFGVVAFGVLVGLALARLVAGRARHHRLAAPIAGAIAGFLVVGLFDSLLDMPRVACLFLVLIVAALLLRNGSGPAVADHQRHPTG
jgi:hypothetical protein